MAETARRWPRFLLVCAGLSIASFLLTPAQQISEHNGIVPVSADELDYLAHATAIVFGTFSYANETSRYSPPNHAVGPSLLAAPVMLGFSLVDRVRGAPVVTQRTEATLLPSWTGFGFPLATELWLLIGTFLLYLTLSEGLQVRRAAGTLLVSVLASGLLYFSHRRSVSSHVYEFAAISAAVYLLWRNPSFGGRSWLKWSVTGLVAIFIFLVRYNDLPLSVALIWATVARDFSPGDLWGWRRDKHARLTALVLLLALVAVVVVTARWSIVGREGHLWQFGKVRQNFFSAHPISYYLNRAWHVFFGNDFGMVMTAPLVLFGLAHSRAIRPNGYLAMPFLLALIGNLALAISWPTQGSGWGYRYFFPAALPLATLGMAQWIERGGESPVRLRYCAAIAVVPVLLLLVFDRAIGDSPGYRSDLALHYENTPWGNGWTNHEYIGRALKTILFEPRETLAIIYRGSGLPVVLGWAGAGHGSGSALAPSDTTKLLLVWTLPLIFGTFISLVARRKVP